MRNYHAFIEAISIHAPREGSDRSRKPLAACIPRFQSTLPVRGATGLYESYRKMISISIHAPREGSDSCLACLR